MDTHSHTYTNTSYKNMHKIVHKDQQDLSVGKGAGCQV